MLGVKATTQPVSMNSVCPGCQVHGLHDRTARMNEGQPIAFELLHDETLAAEETGATALLLHGTRPNETPLGRTQESVFLAHQHAAQLTQDPWG